MTDLESIYITIESDNMATYKVRYYLASQVDEYIKSIQPLEKPDTKDKLIEDLAKHTLGKEYGEFYNLVDRAKRLV